MTNGDFVPAPGGIKEDLTIPMKKFHIAINVADLASSVKDYSERLGSVPVVMVPNEYALWRTPTLNFSIRKEHSSPRGSLRHLGWEDDSAVQFTQETDVNGIVWEKFNEDLQKEEIKQIWPEAEVK